MTITQSAVPFGMTTLRTIAVIKEIKQEPKQIIVNQVWKTDIFRISLDISVPQSI